MLKFVQLKLSKIKYNGDSVGRDIRIEIDVFGKFLRIDKRIKTGTVAEMNQEVGRFETDRELFQTNILISVIEKDLLFNNTGSITDSIKVNTTDNQPQHFTFEIQVRESRSLLSRLFWGKRTAIFEVTLEALVGEIELYTPDIKDGWLVTRDKQDEFVSLPAYIMVHPTHIKNGREYFIPVEGVNRGELLSAPLENGNSSYLIHNVKHEPAISAQYSISEKVFILNGKKYKADDDSKNPWQKGFYDIEIPDYPHGGGLIYPEAVKGTVWFKIGYSGERYLHPGRVSAGCISITETTRWMEIYNAFIKARKGDFMSVGILEVID
ncbi:MAG: hypothetical protein UW04_C0013G0004 [Parcubacteria group bacterium GW2011_GWB1_43_8]|nr:MAG: hypothetical protein UW04_C0013G0004 [Parcubacteria group bacterium GW2011_GWB1_43_8]